MEGRGTRGSVAALLLVPATACAATAAGRAMSDNLEYVTGVADTAQVVEGKFDTVPGKDVLVLTGRFELQDARRERSDEPAAARRFLPEGTSTPPAATGRTRTWSSTPSAS